MNHSNHSYHSSLSAPHLSRRKKLALRKELLLTRAALERATLVQASTELRAKYKHFGWIKWLFPRQATFGKISGLMRSYPILSAISSLLLVPTQVVLRGKVKPLIKWGMLGFTAWQGVRLYLTKLTNTNRSR